MGQWNRRFSGARYLTSAGVAVAGPSPIKSRMASSMHLCAHARYTIASFYIG